MFSTDATSNIENYPPYYLALLGFLSAVLIGVSLFLCCSRADKLQEDDKPSESNNSTNGNTLPSENSPNPFVVAIAPLGDDVMSQNFTLSGNHTQGYDH